MVSDYGSWARLILDRGGVRQTAQPQLLNVLSSNRAAYYLRIWRTWWAGSRPRPAPLGLDVFEILTWFQCTFI